MANPEFASGGLGKLIPDVAASSGAASAAEEAAAQVRAGGKPPPAPGSPEWRDYLTDQGSYAAPGERPDPTGLQQANLVRMGGLLSNTVTMSMNAVGNTVNAAAAIPTHVLASGIDWGRAAIERSPRTRYLAETLPMIKAYGPGIISKLDDAVSILRTGLRPDDMGRLENMAPALNSYYTRVFGIPIGRLLTKTGGQIVDTAVETPLRVLMAADTLQRGGAFSARANGIAVRQALQEGFNGPALERRVAQIMSNLDQFPDVVTEAGKQAARDVLQEKREIPIAGKIGETGVGQKLQGMSEADISKFVQSQVIPFAKTPYNAAAQQIAMSPLGALGAESARRSKNWGEFADRSARAALGTMTMSAGLWAGGNGMLTAEYPDDPKVASTLPQGWLPWSVRIPAGDGAVYVPMQTFGPFGGALALAAVATDATHRNKPWADPSQVAKIPAHLGAYALDSTFLQGVQDFTDMLKDPERFGQRWAEQQAAGEVPFSGFGRELNNIAGMVKRDPREGVRGILDAMTATMPVAASTVPEKTNALGDPIGPNVSGPAAAVVRVGVEKDDPTLKVLRENGVGISPIPKQVNVPSGHVDLSDEEQAVFKKTRGQLIKNYVGNTNLGQANAEYRAKLLGDAVSNANKEAKSRMIAEWSRDRSVWRTGEGGRIQPKDVPEPYYLGAPP